jgi:8-oxo-dGTP diphosphatase
MRDWSVAAYAVVEEEGGVLLTRRRDSNEWVLPGGTVETGEAPWETVVREVGEETGLEVEIESLIGVYVKRREADLVLLFRARPTGGDLRTSDESEEVAFFPRDGLPGGTTRNDRERIDDAVHRRPVVLRIQASQGSEPQPGTR